MDAGLAKVLNSTVGTSSMKSLDQVLDGVMDTVITRNRSLVASDEPYYVFPLALQGWYGTGSTTEKSLVTFKMPLSGSANLIHQVSPGVNGNTSYLLIYVNGTLYKTVTNSSLSSNEWLSETFSFSKGDVIDIRVKLSVSGNRIYGYLRGLNATINSSMIPTDVTVKV